MKRRRLAKIAIYLRLSVAVTIYISQGAYAATFEKLDAIIDANRGAILEALNMPQHELLREFLSRCRGIAVFFTLLKLGFAIGMS